MVDITEEIIRVQVNVKRLAPVGKLRDEALRLRSSLVVIRRIEPFRSVFCGILDVRSDGIIGVGIGSGNKYGTCETLINLSLFVIEE